jgi:hypothetical protein
VTLAERAIFLRVGVAFLAPANGGAHALVDAVAVAEIEIVGAAVVLALVADEDVSPTSRERLR